MDRREQQPYKNKAEAPAALPVEADLQRKPVDEKQVCGRAAPDEQMESRVPMQQGEGCQHRERRWGIDGPPAGFIKMAGIASAGGGPIPDKAVDGVGVCPVHPAQAADVRSSEINGLAADAQRTTEQKNCPANENKYKKNGPDEDVCPWLASHRHSVPSAAGF